MNGCLLRLARASRLLTGFQTVECSTASRYQIQSRFLCTVSTSARFLDVGPNALFEQRRFTNFYNRLSAEKLWKGVTTVSNPGKKRGRGKGRSKILSKDLNRGQIIGQGKQNMVWPGLNAPVFRGRELVRQQELPEDPEREKKLMELRDHMGAFRTMRIPPLERGWSGNWLPGRRVGPPDPIGDEKFEGFDTVVLECKTVSTMTGNLGRKFTYSIFVVTGNGNGVGGFALGKAPSLPAALRKARNRAGQKLIHLERYEDHTVMHDFHSQFGKSRINVHKAPKGFGLVCHRAVRSTCQIIGIKDLHAKVEPSARKNIQHLIKAFFLGLMRQKSYDDMAKETGFLLVEKNPDRLGYPRLLAEPDEDKRLETEAAATRIPDFQSYCFGNRVEYVRRKDVHWYKRLPGWQVHLKKRHRFRNMDDVKLRMLVDYGELRSKYTDKYPDQCVPPQVYGWQKKNKDS